MRHADFPSGMALPYMFKGAIKGELPGRLLQQDILPEKSVIDLVMEYEDGTRKAHGKEKDPRDEPAPVVNGENSFCSFLQRLTGLPSDPV